MPKSCETRCAVHSFMISQLTLVTSALSLYSLGNFMLFNSFFSLLQQYASLSCTPSSKTARREQLQLLQTKDDLRRAHSVKRVSWPDDAPPERHSRHAELCLTKWLASRALNTEQTSQERKKEERKSRAGIYAVWFYVAVEIQRIIRRTGHFGCI